MLTSRRTPAERQQMTTSIIHDNEYAPGEPTELEFGLHDRHYVIGWPYIGPLTADQADAYARYEAYCQERDAEHELEMANGGRTRCPECDQFTVEHHVVEQRRDPTDVGVCKNCGHVDF